MKTETVPCSSKSYQCIQTPPLMPCHYERDTAGILGHICKRIQKCEFIKSRSTSKALANSATTINLVSEGQHILPPSQQQ